MALRRSDYDALQSNFEQGTTLQHLRALQKEVEEDWPSVLQRLRNIHAAVVHSGALTVHLTADAPSLASTAPEIAQLVQALPSAAPAGPRRASSRRR